MAQQSNAGLGTAYPVPYSPGIKDIPDLTPSDVQPPGVDQEIIDYNTVEETLEE